MSAFTLSHGKPSADGFNLLMQKTRNLVLHVHKSGHMHEHGIVNRRLTARTSGGTHKDKTIQRVPERLGQFMNGQILFMLRWKNRLVVIHWANKWKLTPGFNSRIRIAIKPKHKGGADVIWMAAKRSG